MHNIFLTQPSLCHTLDSMALIDDSVCIHGAAPLLGLLLV